MMKTTIDYTYVDTPQCHPKRAHEILKKYPQAKKLMGPNPWSALYISSIVAAQIVAAVLLKESSWWIVFLVSYFFGAFCNHALYVMVHECSHNLIFKPSWANKVMGIVCDFALFFPGAMGFRNYHLIHHKHLGEYTYDPDLVDYREGHMVGNSPWKKILWIFMFFFSQGVLRPMRLKYVKLWNNWVAANLIIQITLNILIFYFFGAKALSYLALSTFFALGLHPLGGRWIQEHYVFKKKQETYSYYGPLNKVTFNMGFHNEHHDLMNISWNNLPKLKKMAPEYYENLHAHYSWTKVLWDFFFKKEMSPFARIVHVPKDKNFQSIKGEDVLHEHEYEMAKV